VLALVLLATMPAHAATLTFGHHTLAQGESKVFPVLISSEDNREIAAVDLYVQVAGGDPDGKLYPFATAVDMLNGTVASAVPSWQIGYGDPWDVYPISSGYQPAFAVLAEAFSGPERDFPANGVLAFITWNATGVPVGTYPVGFVSNDLGRTLGVGTLVPGTITVIANPEPPSLLIGLLAGAGLVGVCIRRGWAKRKFA
jgi:hypothetical protein